MFRVNMGDDTLEMVFEDSAGRDCALAGARAGTGPTTLAFGLRELQLLAEVDGELTVLETTEIRVGNKEAIEKTNLMQGAPMMLDQGMVAALLPVLQHYATHGTMPPLVAVTTPCDDPDGEGH